MQGKDHLHSYFLNSIPRVPSYIHHCQISQGFGRGANGHIDADQIKHGLRKPEVQKSLGIATARSLEELQISGSSGKLFYHNQSNVKKVFQIANPIDRSIQQLPDGWAITSIEKLWHNTANLQQWQEAEDSMTAYIEEMKCIILKYMPLFNNTLDPQMFLRQGLNLCVNGVTVSGTGQSRIACHQDSYSEYPSVMTCNKQKGSTPGDVGGELIIASMGFVCDYGENDVVMLNGDEMHGVLPLTTKKDTKVQKRQSSVLFRST